MLGGRLRVKILPLGYSREEQDVSRIPNMAGCVSVCVHIYGLNAVMSDVTKARRREGGSRAVQVPANDWEK